MKNPGLGGLDADLVRQTLLDAADAAAAKTLAGFRTNLAVENKWQTGFDPVTAADKDAEIAIRAVLGAAFPDHGIIGEEWDAKASAGAFDWIVDPIDGTRAFISGVPVWGTLIGLMRGGRAVAGLMAQPFTGETYLGLPGGAWYRRHGETRPIHTSGVTELGRAKVTATSPDILSARPLTANGSVAAHARTSSSSPRASSMPPVRGTLRPAASRRPAAIPAFATSPTLSRSPMLLTDLVDPPSAGAASSFHFVPL